MLEDEDEDEERLPLSPLFTCFFWLLDFFWLGFRNPVPHIYTMSSPLGLSSANKHQLGRPIFSSACTPPLASKGNFWCIPSIFLWTIDWEKKKLSNYQTIITIIKLSNSNSIDWGTPRSKVYRHFLYSFSTLGRVGSWCFLIWTLDTLARKYFFLPFLS